MFDRITLGFDGDTHLISNRLNNHPQYAFPISVVKQEAETPVTYISFEATDDVFLLNQYVNVLAEYIMERYENRILRRVLETEYSHLTVIQKREILKNKERFSDDPQVGYKARKQTVILSVFDYFNEESTMMLEGFVDFRLKEYESLLSQLAELLVEDYMARKEYEEFISLLTYFVNVQKERPPQAHVLVHPAGGYGILDGAKKDITAQCFADFLEGEVLLTEEAYDDLLLSVLITLAPEKITVHNSRGIRNKELFSTISQVFKGKIVYCEGCDLCPTLATEKGADRQERESIT